LWLDEGLAEYFELPPDKQGVSEQHLNQIRRSMVDPFKPSLTRLETLDQVKDMTPSEYREAWAWVHYFLRGNKDAKTALLGYLQQLRNNAQPGQLRPRLAQVIVSPEEDLGKHIDRLEYTPAAQP
jgi:hypothetical protein